MRNQFRDSDTGQEFKGCHAEPDCKESETMEYGLSKSSDSTYKIKEGEKVIDSYMQSFGIRTVSATTKGFFLNGKKINITG